MYVCATSFQYSSAADAANCFAVCFAPWGLIALIRVRHKCVLSSGKGGHNKNMLAQSVGNHFHISFVFEPWLYVMLRVSRRIAFHGCGARVTKRLDVQLTDGCQLP